MGLGLWLLLGVVSLIVGSYFALLPLGSGRAVGPAAVVMGVVVCALMLAVSCTACMWLAAATGPLLWPALQAGFVLPCLMVAPVRVEVTMWWLTAARGALAAAWQLISTCRSLAAATLLYPSSATRMPVASLYRLPLITAGLTLVHHLLHLPPIPEPVGCPSIPLPYISLANVITLLNLIPLVARLVSTYHPPVWDQCMRKYWLLVLHVTVQHIRSSILLKHAVHLFMAPYLPNLARESRSAHIKRMHSFGIYLKTSKLKHIFFAPRGAAPMTRLKSPPVTAFHRRVLLMATILLTSSTMAAAGGVGLSGIAAAMSSAGAGQLAAANLQHLALVDPGMAFQRVCRTQQPAAAPGDAYAAFAAIDQYQPDGVTTPDAGVSYWKDPDNEWVIGNHPGMSQFQREQLQDLLLSRRSTCFAYSLSELSGYTGAKFVIELEHDRPIRQRMRQHSLFELAIQDEKCVEMAEAGIIRPADPDTQYASNCTMPANKDVDGNWTDFRFCVDFRNINAACVADHYGMHLAEDLFQCVGASEFYSKIDLRGAYHQILLEPSSQSATSFYWRNQLWCFNRMPFGMRNASACCQRIMDLEIGKAGLRDCCACFVDDLLVHSKTAEEHLVHVVAVLDMLASCGLRAHPAKSMFGCASVEYLGHNVSAKGLTPHEAKLAAVKGLRVPSNVSELKSVLGFLNFYRCYVPRFSEIAAPLNELLGSTVTWEWTARHQNAYQQIKDAMCKEGAALKRYDPARELLVYADWSKAGIAAVLAQHDDDGNEYMVACTSRSLNKHERNYCSYEGECLAAVYAAKTFRKYLFGRHFTIVTDHQPLKWLMATPDLSGKHMRWALSMQEFDCTIEHRPGAVHQNVDVSSRMPSATEQDPTGACMDQDHAAPGAGVSQPAMPAGACPVAGLAVRSSPTRYNPASALTTACYSGAVAHVLEQAGFEAALSAGGGGFMDAFAPSVGDLLAGHAGALSDPVDAPPEVKDPAAAAETRVLRSNASQLVWGAIEQLQQVRPEPLQRLEAWDDIDACGVATRVTKLCTQRVGSAVFAAGMGDGVVLYEACGGMAAGLDALLANGVRVKRYLYSDIDEAVGKAAQARVAALHCKYPHLLPLGAYLDAFSALPADVRHVDSEALLGAGAGNGEQWLMVAGWSCEDLSAAGKGMGLRGTRSSNFFDVVRIVGALQQLQPDKLPGFVLENTNMESDNNHESVRHHDFPGMCKVLGRPVLLDAARCGAYAYRLRNFWSNLCDPVAVAVVCDSIVRAPGRVVNDVLDPGHQAQLAVRPQRPPWYQCNAVRGHPLEALPTLVAYVGSRAYRVHDDGYVPRGLLWVDAEQRWAEPNPEERERIMGYPTGCTAVDGVSDRQRHEIVGRAMDRHALTTLFSVYSELSSNVQHLTALACRAASMPRMLQPAARELMQPLSRRQLQDSCPVGYRQMQQMGWQPGQLLGAGGSTGLPWPLLAQATPAKQGLGFVACVTVQGGGVEPVAATAQLPQAQLFDSPVRGGRDLVAIPENAALIFEFDVPAVDDAAESGASQQCGVGWVGGSCNGSRQAGGCASSSVMQQVADGQLPGRGAATGGSARGEVFLGRVSDSEIYALHTALATEAEVVEQLGGVVGDVLEDSNVLQYLHEGKLPAGMTVSEQRRVRRRSRHYEMNGEAVIRMMADGTRRVVPPINKRVDLIRETHQRTGHWGIRRTAGLLLSSHWWHGLERDVAKVLATCKECDQVKANFSAKDPKLHSLPISGLFYRWGVDLAGPFVTSTRGNEYVMVCIEHFSKHVELIAIPDKSADTTAFAFLSHVIGRFGACAEVITDQGSEFLGAFHLLLEDCMIDHRTTSANHPQADGLAERCVQSIKLALSKHALQQGTLRNWDEQLHWIALGYRSSKQAASGLSPYQMMYGCEPCVPPAIKDRYRPGLALVFDTPDHREQAAEYLVMRAALLRENCSIAFTNLRSAQHRDGLQYMRVRSGFYRPRMVKFTVGQFVHVKRQNVTNTLMSDARPGIFRVLEVRDSGVIVVQGKCGSTMQVNSQNCAPCWLMNIDHRLDHSLRRPGVDECCVVCNSSEDEAIMLMCDGCGKGYHTYCLQPPLAGIPDAIVWLCPKCEAGGVQVEPILRLREAEAVGKPLEAAMFPSVQQRAADAVAARLDGTAVTVEKDRRGGELVEGVFRFVPREDRPVQYVRRPLKLQRLGMEDLWCTEKAARKLLAQSPVRQLTAALAAAKLHGGYFVAASTVAGGKLPKAAAEKLPGGWKLGTVAGCAEACHALFGTVPAEEHQQLCASYMRAQHCVVEACGDGAVVDEMPADDVRMLLNVVDVRSCGRLVCPWAAEGGLQDVVMGRYARQVMTGNKHLDALFSPGFYQHASRQSPVDWVFLCAPVGLEEVALAVAVAEAAVGVALLTHASFLTSGPAHRQLLLQRFMDQGRVALVTEKGTQSMWVVVFATAGHLERMVTRSRVGLYCEILPSRQVQ